MRCGKAKKLISLLLDERLDEKTARAVQAHLATCRACRKHHTLLQTGQQALSAQGPAAVPARLAERAATAAFEAERRAASQEADPPEPAGLWEQLWGLKRPALVTTAAAVAAAAVLALLPVFGLQDPNGPAAQAGQDPLTGVASASLVGLTRVETFSAVLAESAEPIRTEEDNGDE
jgi:anti-sigma factor RsiW